MGVLAALVVVLGFVSIRARRKRRAERTHEDAQRQVHQTEGAANLARATELPEVTREHSDRMALRFSRQRQKPR